MESLSQQKRGDSFSFYTIGLITLVVFVISVTLALFVGYLMVCLFKILIPAATYITLLERLDNLPFGQFLVYPYALLLLISAIELLQLIFYQVYSQIKYKYLLMAAIQLISLGIVFVLAVSFDISDTVSFWVLFGEIVIYLITNKICEKGREEARFRYYFGFFKSNKA